MYKVFVITKNGNYSLAAQRTTEEEAISFCEGPRLAALYGPDGWQNVYVFKEVRAGQRAVPTPPSATQWVRG